jgi:2,5-furandicarboxylate decarboxylase 1
MMSVQPAMTAGGPAAVVDYDRFRLRNFLTALAQEGELETYAEPAKLAEVGTILSETAKAVWFQQVGPERAALAGNVLASRSRLARAFGVAPRQLLAEILKRLDHKPEIVEVSRSEAPVQQVVATGDEIDLTRLPVHLQHGLDGGPYISAALDFAHNKCFWQASSVANRCRSASSWVAIPSIISPARCACQSTSSG